MKYIGTYFLNNTVSDLVANIVRNYRNKKDSFCGWLESERKRPISIDDYIHVCGIYWRLLFVISTTVPVSYYGMIPQRIAGWLDLTIGWNLFWMRILMPGAYLG